MANLSYSRVTEVFVIFISQLNQASYQEAFITYWAPSSKLDLFSHFKSTSLICTEGSKRALLRLKCDLCSDTWTQQVSTRWLRETVLHPIHINPAWLQDSVMEPELILAISLLWRKHSSLKLKEELRTEGCLRAAREMSTCCFYIDIPKVFMIKTLISIKI